MSYCVWSWLGINGLCLLHRRRGHRLVAPLTLPKASIRAFHDERPGPSRQPAQRVRTVDRSSQNSRQREHERESFTPLHALRPASHPPLRQARPDRPRQDIQRDFASSPALFDPYTAPTYEAPGERAPEGPVPDIVRDTREETREEGRAREADGGPDTRDECAEEGGAAKDREECLEELGGTQEGVRAGEQDGQEVHLRVGKSACTRSVR